MNKVQTGLRIPEERYNELCEVANEMGGHCAYPKHKYRKVCDCCQNSEFRKDK